MYLSIYLYIYRSISLSIYQSIYLYCFLSHDLPIWLCNHLIIYLSINRSLDLSVYQSISRSVCLSIDLSVYISVYLASCLCFSISCFFLASSELFNLLSQNIIRFPGFFNSRVRFPIFDCVIWLARFFWTLLVLIDSTRKLVFLWLSQTSHFHFDVFWCFSTFFWVPRFLTML